MKTNNIIRIVRWLITLALLGGVYSETGKWTTLALFFIALSIEAISHLIWTASELLKAASERFLQTTKR